MLKNHCYRRHGGKCWPPNIEETSSFPRSVLATFPLAGYVPSDSSVTTAVNFRDFAVCYTPFSGQLSVPSMFMTGRYSAGENFPITLFLWLCLGRQKHRSSWGYFKEKRSRYYWVDREILTMNSKCRIMAKILNCPEFKSHFCCKIGRWP